MRSYKYVLKRIRKYEFVFQRLPKIWLITPIVLSNDTIRQRCRILSHKKIVFLHTFAQIRICIIRQIRQTYNTLFFKIRLEKSKIRSYLVHIYRFFGFTHACFHPFWIPEGELLVKKVMSWEREFGGSLVWGVCNFAVNLEPNSLLIPSQIRIFWLKIHPQSTG